MEPVVKILDVYSDHDGKYDYVTCNNYDLFAPCRCEDCTYDTDGNVLKRVSNPDSTAKVKLIDADEFLSTIESKYRFIVVSLGVNNSAPCKSDKYRINKVPANFLALQFHTYDQPIKTYDAVCRNCRRPYSSYGTDYTGYTRGYYCKSCGRAY